jgi:hypothetical protein
MSESLSRLTACETENAALKSENERLRGQLGMIDSYFDLKERLPNEDQTRTLYQCVVTRFPRLRGQYTVTRGTENNLEAEVLAGFRIALAYIFSLKVTRSQ